LCERYAPLSFYPYEADRDLHIPNMEASLAKEQSCARDNRHLALLGLRCGDCGRGLLATLEIIRRDEFSEGRWPNGAGISWDIASAPPNVAPSEKNWRFSTALIERDAPFSMLPGVDRIITLIDGAGFMLDVDGLDELLINRPFVPTPFPGDSPAACRVEGGASTVLNLLLARSRIAAEVSVHREGAHVAVSLDCEVVLLFALAGRALLTSDTLEAHVNPGDAAILRPNGDIPLSFAIGGSGIHLYTAVLYRSA
jgi:environmental stress-induced protein Ves